MAFTARQERYARLVASGKDFHTSALEAGCKNHESARKFVSDMNKRKNVQAFIAELRAVQSGLDQANQGDKPTATPKSANAKYETPLEFLTAVFNNADDLYTPKERISAAIALLPYTEQKLAQTGKKEDILDNAYHKSRSGRFATLSNQADIFESRLLQ
ncbi:hypothetical protein MOMA_09316 [Moraxella macacae 0408225]|uniref:Terminase small subunit n=1 Tax=Moraxella macacae 0408225 TaxID=1230338 RepID=L2F6S9_9GAMM|nr:hypothetical protein [Moraxella macacae]ELA08747.1 hypothetical protein MOMA_09316 [Moraxella macacae 0408225]